MNIKTSIKSGNSELISSGSFLSKIDNEIILTLDSGIEAPLNLILRFKTDENTNEKLSRDAKAIDDTTLDITFTNYNSPLGSFNKELWEIGTIAKRRLSMAYVIYGFTDSKIKKIEYSFYLDMEVRNG